MLSFESIQGLDHEFVIFFQDEAVGLKGFIAIHNTQLGPATGGTRYMVYSSEQEALQDALRLSKAMTYKCALAGVAYGGGKAVIIADPSKPKTKEYLQVYAKKVTMLGGKFYTGEDVGMNQQDIEILAENCPFINGRPSIGGSPSPWAALSVFYAMQAGLEATFGSASPQGKTFAIKGLGHLGIELCSLLYESGGIVTAADVNPERTALAQKKFPHLKIVSPDIIHTLEVDAYAPCALGNEFNQINMGDIRCKIICGGANNQLVVDDIGEEFFKKNILYIPDYVANAGGLINVTSEWDPEGYSQERVHTRVKKVQQTVANIIALSKKEKKPTNFIANAMAQDILTLRHHRTLSYAS